MRVKIISKGLNVRKYPDAKSDIKAVLKFNDEVLVLETLNGWHKIDKGWISAKFTEEENNNITISQRTMSIALSQLGLEEMPRGSNWGKNVQKYLNSVGINFPASWCMAYVYWCVNEASKEMNIANPLLKTGGVLSQWNASKSLRVTNPQKGDIFIMDFGGGKCHTGFVTSVANGVIQTCEGNSNDEGSREGFEVCRKPGGRKISSCKGFLRLV